MSRTSTTGLRGTLWFLLAASLGRMIPEKNMYVHLTAGKSSGIR